MADKYDVIVIGAGPGGMTAALYASRANLKVAMLDRGVYGGNMNNTAEIENYPGFKMIMGPDLSEEMYQSATNFGAEFVYGNVEKIEEQVRCARRRTIWWSRCIILCCLRWCLL